MRKIHLSVCVFVWWKQKEAYLKEKEEQVREYRKYGFDIGSTYEQNIVKAILVVILTTSRIN